MTVQTVRLISAKPSSPQEEQIERSLRPATLAEYVGQEKTRGQLEIFIEAARRRGEALDHVLLFGPPGLGKTTLAHIIARELGVNLRQTSGPVLERPPFTLAGATTRAGMLTNPLRDRFGIVARLEFYTQQELASIVRRSAGLLKVALDEAGASEIACRSRGTPRVANRLLRRVRDYAEVKADGRVTKAIAEAALKMLDVDALGLDVMDRKLLLAVIEKFSGGPVGLENLAHAIGEDAETIEDVLEPYLIQQGYLQRTPRGRMATLTAYRHFGIVAPAAARDLLSDS